MTKDELIEWINNDITVSGTLDINIPKKEIERIIDQSVKEIYELYPDSLQSGFIILNNSVFKHSEFKKNRTLQFPDCVLAVTRFEEMNRRNGVFGFGDRDLCMEKMFMSDAFYGGYGLMNSDILTSRIISYSAYDQLKTFSLCSIQFDYNRNTHKLLVKGHDPRTHVICEIMAAIPDQDLFNDPWVRRYISAKCKIRVYRMLGTFTTNLLSGTTINANIYKEEADNDLQDVKEYFKTCTVNSTFFLDFY